KMKLPNVSWPIESEKYLGIVEFGGNSEVMISRPGSNRAAIYDGFRAGGNKLKPLGKTPESPAAGPGSLPAGPKAAFREAQGPPADPNGSGWPNGTTPGVSPHPA